MWCDNDSVQGVLHANFKLSAENEGVWLTAPDGVTVLDSIVYPPQQTDVSFGRSCDGCEDWVFFNVPTPESANVDQVLPTPALYLNEVLLDNSNVLIDENAELDAWIEVYNPNAFQVNLGGYTLSSSLGDTFSLPTDNPVETMVPAEGFLLLWMDGQPESGRPPFGLVGDQCKPNVHPDRGRRRGGRHVGGSNVVFEREFWPNHRWRPHDHMV